MKRGMLFIFILIAIMGFANAQGLGELLAGIDQPTVIIFAVFMVSFCIFFFALNKVLKGNTAIVGIISVVISFLIAYWINKSELDIESIFFNIGISSEILGVIIPIIIIAGIIFLIVKLAKNSLLILGALGIFVGLFNIIEARLVPIVAGAILIIIRLFIKRGKWEPPKRERKN